MAIKVLLATTTRWPSAGRLAGAFHAAGCMVDAILPPVHPARESRYFARRHAYRPLRGAQSIAQAVDAAKPDLVVPLDDRAVALLLDIPGRKTSKIIEHSLGNTANYAKLISRAGFIESARQAQIRTPQTCALASIAELESALAEIGFPAVLKADGTWGGDGVAIVNNREEALAAFRRLREPPSALRSMVRAIRRSDAHHLLAAFHAKPGVLSIQQFIAGTPATTTMACWQGKVLAANHLEVLVAQHATGPASVLRRIDNAEMDAAAARLAAQFGLSGLHGLDYVMDAQGNAHLIEINPRAPQTSYLGFGPSHDLTAALARQLGANPIPRRAIAQDTVALFPQEWLRDPGSPHLKSAYHDVPWDDPPLIRACLASKQAQGRNGEQFLAALPGARVAGISPGTV